ncbi:prolyl oligopeptidase [Boletus edulis BED1]|uniref:Prolyl endopeptidase n=1 Tax=Boletus edulis BED1 TaxID=1328754 RepID=A0AAD4C4I4_BOLED|nr:prolyl oligopeptidase [Boletus edulis BED1]
MLSLCRFSNPTTRGSRLLSFTWFPTRLPQSPPTRIIRSLSRSTASLARTMSPPPWTPNQYPPARRCDHVDAYESEKQGHVRVADPYQWLEEHTDETDAWTSAQDAFTRNYLDKNTDRAKLEKEIRVNTNYEKFSAPVLKYDGRWYWYYNSGLQAQSVLYRSSDEKLPDFSKDGGAKGEVFFDPNQLSDDGTAALSVTAFSRDGNYYAYGISLSGSDFCTIYIRETSKPLAAVAGKRMDHHEGCLSDEIRFVKFSSISWTHDSKGFFYQRFPSRESHGIATEDKAGTETTGDKDAMLYYHRVGTPQSQDILVMKDAEHREWMWGTSVSELDGRYLFLSVSRDTARKNLLWVADLQENEIGQNIKWEKLIDKFEAEYDVIANDGTKLYIRTNLNAPKHKIVTIDLADPKLTQVDLIPEEKDASLSDILAVGKDKFAVVYKRNVIDEIYLYSLTGEKLTRMASSLVGAAEVSGRRALSDVFVSMTGFTNPGIIGHLDMNKFNATLSLESAWRIYHTTDVGGLRPDEFTAEQVWYESKDGTKIPMFIVRHKSTKTDGTAPAIQYGYGGFSVSINPFFSPSILTFLKSYGAVFALPNIRGGGEFGEEWHNAGIMERKINVFDDFIAATEHLVKNKIAAVGKVAINGASNGGLLVGACVNIAPQGTFGAAVAEVGVMDLLKFADFTIGKAWTADYGDPHDPHDFDFIHPISPVHNVPKDRTLPPLLLMTADHDDRVVPLHSFKLAATLQHALPHNPHPLLIRIDKKAGHGAGKATEKRIQDAADKWGFVAQSLGLKWQADS